MNFDRFSVIEIKKMDLDRILEILPPAINHGKCRIFLHISKSEYGAGKDRQIFWDVRYCIPINPKSPKIVTQSKISLLDALQKILIELCSKN